ncbi:MAG TPA: hypothetical protein VK808_11940 [Bacteroidia bacterium]|nr:hypothetical protein [Bacteroidia bacterium]
MFHLKEEDMISILYPEGDYEAADIALKAQSLSYSSNTNIYIVPKHYGRNEEAIYKNLGKAKLAIFIMYENGKIDANTIKELEYLTSKDVKIYSIIPEPRHNISRQKMRKQPGFSILDKTETITYPSTDKTLATKKMHELTSKLIANQNTLSRNKDVIAGVTLVMLIVLLLSSIGQPSKT